jgi:beta-phosphoglucomutase
MIRHTKPHPEIFLTAAKELKLEPENCVVIEDAEAGVVAALAAGMKCIGIGDPERLYGANKVFRKTTEVRFSTLRELETVNN